MYAVFFNSIWKNLHLTGNFYTGTACGACDKYEVWIFDALTRNCQIWRNRRKKAGSFPLQKVNEFHFLCNYYQFRAPEQVLYQVCPPLDSSESERRVAKFPYDESFTYICTWEILLPPVDHMFQDCSRQFVLNDSHCDILSAFIRSGNSWC